MKSRILKQHELNLLRKYGSLAKKATSSLDETINQEESTKSSKISDEIYVYIGSYKKINNGDDKVVPKGSRYTDYVEFCSIDDNNKEPFVILSPEYAEIFEKEHYVVYSKTPKNDRDSFYKFYRAFKKNYELELMVSKENADSFCKGFFKK